MFQAIEVAKLSFADFQDKEKTGMSFTAVLGPPFHPFALTGGALPTVPTSYLLAVAAQAAPPDTPVHRGTTFKQSHRCLLAQGAPTDTTPFKITAMKGK